jgi:transmembrane sensor
MTMADISARDQRAAQAWMVKMLDDPVRHRVAFDQWASAKPGRLEYYESLLGDIQIAGRAAREIRLVTPDRVPRPNRGSRAIALGFAVAVVLVMIIGWRVYLGVVGPETGQIVRGLETKIGEVRTERLQDGSTIILDTNSEVSTTLDASTRAIELKHGRARFIVAHDKDRPFIVKAGGYEVVATGTEFDVTLRGGFGVHLLKGSIEVRPASSFTVSVSLRSLKLRPGQQINITNGQTGIPSAMPARESDEQWVNGVKSFDDVPIKDVIAEANSYSVTQIQLADPSLGEREIFGDINIRDIDAVARAIADYLQLRIDKAQPGKLVLTAAK